MSKIVLISCVSKKLNHKAKAEDLYISSLFKKSLGYAKSINSNKIFILSAKYGLLELDKEISPYDKTLNKMTSQELKEWAKTVLNQLQKISDSNKDEFIFLAGKNYRKLLIPYIKNYRIPMLSLSIGKQLKWLTNNTKKMSKTCELLHQWFNMMRKHSFPFNMEEIPENGIYILFEKCEFSHSTNRIVRIGTHNGNNKLKSRLSEHFLKENKDRSIFRKNIGRALLNKDKDKFLVEWELDLTTKKAKDEFSSSIDYEKQKQIENKVTKYIQENFTFAAFEINDKIKRLEFESKIISTISSCHNCKPSQNWLGLCSPKDKIRKSGLWLINELYKNPLTNNDMLDLKQMLKIE